MTLGTVRTVFPEMEPRFPGDHTCIYGLRTRGAWYKGVFGYNARQPGQNGIHLCCDGYFQGPANDEWYNWFLLRDVYEPTQWYMALDMHVWGVRNLGMPRCTVPPPPSRA